MALTKASAQQAKNIEVKEQKAIHVKDTVPNKSSTNNVKKRKRESDATDAKQSKEKEVGKQAAGQEKSVDKHTENPTQVARRLFKDKPTTTRTSLFASAKPATTRASLFASQSSNEEFDTNNTPTKARNQ